MTAKVAILVTAAYLVLSSMIFPHIPYPWNWIIFLTLLFRIWWDPIATFLDNEL